jgi:hypothetical protein
MAYNLNQVSALSVQELVRDGSPHDIYYYDSSNMFVQARPTLSNNKFIQNFVSYSSGVNQLIFSPDQGLTDVMCGFVLKTGVSYASAYTNYSLNKGWGYALINQVAVRYGGSSQYFWSGGQMLMENVIEMNDAVSRDALYRYGGSACMGTNPLSGANDFSFPQEADVYINLPHNSPNSDGAKPNPLPTELLRQPVLVQVSLNTVTDIFSGNATAGGTPLNVPNGAIERAYFQVKQVRMINSDDLLTAHHDPAKISYTLPLKAFYQQEYTLLLPAQSANLINNVNLTGFRNGGVRSIILWLTNNSDTPAVGSTGLNGGRNYNPNVWTPPTDITLSINGEIFYTTIGKSSLLFDLVCNKQPNELSSTYYSTLVNGATAPIVGGITSQYVKVDFSQCHEAVFGTNMLIGGKSITNSIVNLQFSVPQTPSNIPAVPVDYNSKWVLHAMYAYNSSLVFAGGNCEYVF